jgi:hypothetical protein
MTAELIVHSGPEGDSVRYRFLDGSEFSHENGYLPDMLITAFGNLVKFRGKVGKSLDVVASGFLNETDESVLGLFTGLYSKACNVRINYKRISANGTP